MWGRRRPRAGDWVVLARDVRTLRDHLIGTRVRRGSRGVVTRVRGSRVDLDVEARWGTRRVTTSRRHVTVSRSRGGVGRFHHRTRRRAALRTALALALLSSAAPLDAGLRDPARGLATAVLVLLAVRVAWGSSRRG